MAKPAGEPVTAGPDSVDRPEGRRGDEERRYERKFVTRELSLQDVTMALRLHPLLFSSPYPPRWVNSIYWDTAELACYRESMDGVSVRAKFRVRWYGDPLGRVRRPILEVKRKIGHEGWKELRRVPPFDILPGVAGSDIRRQVLRPEAGPRNRALLGALEPILLGRYLRRYYLSANGRFRVTVDSDVSWYPMRLGPNAFAHPRTSLGTLIIELKYDCLHDEEASLFTSHLPLRLTRNSKYTEGVDQLRD